MSRFGSTKAHAFHLRRFAPDHFRMSWTVDFYYPTSRLRHPRVFSRDTDKAGAERFAKRHRIAMPL